MLEELQVSHENVRVGKQKDSVGASSFPQVWEGRADREAKVCWGWENAV